MQLSVMPSEKKNPANSPKKLLFFIKKNAIWKNIICKARSNLMMPIQRSSRLTCFFCFPQKVPKKFSQEK
jgi:hypothetical protein